MNTRRLSVVIPVYNVEAYVWPCVESLLQIDRFCDLEVILVDDGSKDRSGEICDKIASLYKNIVVIHQPNKGLSDARNTGIKYASGEYVTFIDSDDFVDPRLFSSAMKAMEIHPDVVIYDWNYVSEDGKTILKREKHQGVKERLYSTIDFVCEQIKASRYYWTIACQGFFKREMLMKNEIFFFKGIYHEDDLWFPHMILAANSVYYFDKPVYQYRMREGSITKDGNKNDKRHLMDLLSIFNGLYGYIDTNCADLRMAALMKKDISRRYLHSIYRFRAYRFQDCCKNINKRQILRNSFLLDKIRAVILMMSDKGYYWTMDCAARIKS